MHSVTLFFVLSAIEMKNRNRRKGRPPKFVQDPNGRPIVGLSYNKANSCYYATYSKPRVYFGTNLADALFKFRQWENKQAIEEPYMEISLPYPPGSEGSKIVRWSECCGDPHVIAAAHAGESALIPENIFLEMARNFILKDTINAARKLGIPELARMEDLPPLEPPLSLDALLEFYINRRKPSKEEVKKMKSSWKEFCRIIQVQTVREISSNTIHNYRDVIWEEYEKQGWANSWLRARFNRVKTLFNYSFKHGRTNKKELKTVLDFCRCLSVPSSVEEDAKPIEREHVHQLLDHCDIKWRDITLYWFSVNWTISLYG